VMAKSNFNNIRASYGQSLEQATIFTIILLKTLSGVCLVPVIK